MRGRLLTIRTAEAGNGLDDLYLVAVFAGDQVADVDNALQAGVRTVLLPGCHRRVSPAGAVACMVPSYLISTSYDHLEIWGLVAPSPAAAA